MLLDFWPHGGKRWLKKERLSFCQYYPLSVFVWISALWTEPHVWGCCFYIFLSIFRQVIEDIEGLLIITRIGRLINNEINHDRKACWKAIFQTESIVTAWNWVTKRIIIMLDRHWDFVHRFIFKYQPSPRRVSHRCSNAYWSVYSLVVSREACFSRQVY